MSSSPRMATARDLAATIEAGIVDRFGYRAEVMLRTANEMKRLATRNPFPEMAEADPSHLVVMFLAGLPTAEDRAALRMEWDGPERWEAVGADLFICYPKGIGRSKLKLKLKTAGTARNWTVATLRWRRWPRRPPALNRAAPRP